MRGIGTAVAAALLVTGVTAATANATTITATSGLTYTCTYPGIPPRPATLTAHLSVTDPHTGQAFTVTPSLTQVFPAAVHSLLTAAGYDQVRGSIAATFAVSGATPASGTIAGGFPAQPITTFSVTGSPQVFTAGAAFAVGFTLGPAVTEALEFHRANGTWVPWTSNCTLEVTSPAQNTAFSPSVPIT